MSPRLSHHRVKLLTGCLMTAAMTIMLAFQAFGQAPAAYHGDPIHPEIEAMYQRGLNFLVQTQTEAGSWSGTRGSEPAVVGVAVLAMLAHGDDPVYGPYAQPIKRGVNYILSVALPSNGYIGSSMYNHGFATLALAEAYGAIDDERIGPALRKAVDLILTSQSSNSRGAWRYSPTSTDADVTVSGAQMVALLAARNAGLAVPEAAIERAVKFFQSCQASSGGFGYTSSQGGNSAPRSAIGTLALALARYKDSKAFQAAVRNLKLEVQKSGSSSSYHYYYLYYAAQALFHSDMALWKTWSLQNAQQLAASQSQQGSWSGSNGPTFSTAAALLSLAVNYRFLPIYER